MGMSPSRRSMPAVFALMLVADDAAVGDAAPDCCRGVEAHAETHAASVNDPKRFDLMVWGNWESRDYPTGTVPAQVCPHRAFEVPCPAVSLAVRWKSVGVSLCDARPDPRSTCVFAMLAPPPVPLSPRRFCLA